jgi:DNA-binding LytR/AlgR family response regulator
MPCLDEIERAAAALEPRDFDDAITPFAQPFLSTLQTLRERVKADPGLLDALLNRVIEMQATRMHLRWIKAGIGRDVALIDVRSVLYFQADTKYTRVVTTDNEALIRKPLRALIDELDPSSFWLIHRSTIVNAAAIAGFTRDAHGRAVLKLKSRPERLPVSATHEYQFRQM